jgi:hypothetical protein
LTYRFKSTSFNVTIAAITKKPVISTHEPTTREVRQQPLAHYVSLAISSFPKWELRRSARMSVKGKGLLRDAQLTGLAFITLPGPTPGHMVAI